MSNPEVSRDYLTWVHEVVKSGLRAVPSGPNPHLHHSKPDCSRRYVAAALTRIPFDHRFRTGSDVCVSAISNMHDGWGLINPLVIGDG